MAFSLPTPKTAIEGNFVPGEENWGGERTAVLRLVVCAPDTRRAGCTDVHELLTAVARIGRGVGFAG